MTATQPAQCATGLLRIVGTAGVLPALITDLPALPAGEALG
ncbi:hypothetical protein [Nocardia aurantia]|uniref:Uncharacterized protein n=1 Tax=Nocardia aurantia TaxID=2585199 RepID=A0A7K0DKI2_9NOCA|nr:hypothetical protein [Nocardia aurantia]MQY26300.1 hypothetical protein [Nocardia aurantia]